MKKYITYDDNYEFKGFFNNIDAIHEFEKIYDTTIYFKEITENLFEYLFLALNNSSSKVFNKNILEYSQEPINNKDIFTIVTLDNKIQYTDYLKTKLSELKLKCKTFIVNGLSLEYEGEYHHFMYNLEDQSNLRNIILNYKSGDYIYYHGTQELSKMYSYDFLKSLYIALENNKNYNLIYLGVVSEWLQNNFNSEMYENKIVITYGFSNDDINTKVNEIYATQVLK